MNSASIELLLGTAISIALVHTLIGIDHYLPFVMIGRARNWSWRKLMAVTAICGIGHVIGSIALGFVGIGVGIALEKLEWVESMRGIFSAWGLIAFGLIYAGWSLWKSRTRHHSHTIDAKRTVTFWSLFIVFALGPCEPLIPLLMFPAASHAWGTVAAVSGLFAFTTIATMMLMVLVLSYGLRLPRFRGLEHHAHTIAGVTIAGSGLAIQVLGI